METLTQAQNEALVKLLLALRYQDHLLAFAESQAFNAQVATLSWQSVTPVDRFLMQATSSVRSALANDASRQAFIAEQCAALREAGVTATALRAIETVAKADGLHPAESSFLQQIKTQLHR